MKRLPVKLMYFEEFARIDEAYYREKQVQGWRRKKKQAPIDGDTDLLSQLAIAYRDRHDLNKSDENRNNTDSSEDRK